MKAQGATSHSNKLPSNTNSFDLSGKPDSISNLRPVKFHIRSNETSVEKLYRLERARVQEWNSEFWTKHNKAYKLEKEEFFKNNLLNEGNEDSHKSDEMSMFYKQFLDKNWKTHCTYNMDWYKKNLYLSSLALRVHINRILKFCKLL